MWAAIWRACRPMFRLLTRGGTRRRSTRSPDVGRRPRLAGLVNLRRDGRRVLYRARCGHVRRLLAEVMNAADHHLHGIPDHD